MRTRTVIGLLVGCRLLLGMTYSLIIPPWEGVDEDAHVAYSQYLARWGRLPASGDPEAAAIREAHQPPLYYALIALFLRPFGAERPYPDVDRNPYLSAGAGFNYAIRSSDPADMDQGALTALYVGRLVTIVMTTASMIAVYGAARRLWPADLLAALVAATLYAFWPQALYLGSVVNNDAMIMAWSALVFYAAIRVALDGATPGRLILLTIGLVGAPLIKLNGLALAVPATTALVGGALRLRKGGLMLGVAALGLLATLTGLTQMDFVRAQVFRAQTVQDFLVHAGQDRWFGLGLVAPGIAHALRSFLAEFGWGNIYLPEPVYGFWGLALAAAIVALANSLFEAQTRLPVWPMAIALGQVAAVVGLEFALGVSTGSGFILLGRYLLPAWPAAVLLWVAGWRSLRLGSGPQIALRALAVSSLLTGWIAPWVALAPAYARPQLLGPEAAVAHPIGATFDGAIELIGYQTIARLPVSGGVAVTLCWRPLRVVDRDYTIRISALDAAGANLGELTTYPGHGTFPTSDWPPGARFCERYVLLAHSTYGPADPTALTVSVLDTADLTTIEPDAPFDGIVLTVPPGS